MIASNCEDLHDGGGGGIPDPGIVVGEKVRWRQAMG